jgi:predicted MPP superfamily phosphohydrolase
MEQAQKPTHEKQYRKSQKMRQRWMVGVVVVPLVYYLIFAYPLLRVRALLDDPSSLSTFTISLLALFPLLGRLLYERLANPVTRRIAQTAMTWTGISFIGLFTITFIDIITTLIPKASELKLELIIGLTGTLVLISTINAFLISVKNITIESRKITTPKRLVQISDVHIGSRDPGYLDRVINRVATLNPDYLLVTGDLVDMNGFKESDFASFKAMKCPVLFVIGNHERYIRLEEVLNMLRNNGMEILRNEASAYDEIQFIGIDDAEYKRNVSKELPLINYDTEKYCVLLYHRPDNFGFAASHGIDLMLCGHTHRGQIIPFHWLVKIVFKRIHGLYTRHRAKLYVSPGTGTWGPIMRLGSRNEITVLDLKPGIE